MNYKYLKFKYDIYKIILLIYCFWKFFKCFEIGNFQQQIGIFNNNGYNL